MVRAWGRGGAALGAALVAAGLTLAGTGPGTGLAPPPAGATPGAPSQPGPLPPIMQPTELRPPPGGQPGEVPIPHDVNDRGEVVGESGGRAVLWRDGQPTVLPGGEGGGRAVATQIDDRGRVYVDLVDAGAYRWEDGRVTPIETPYDTLRPWRANDEGQVLIGDRGLWDDGEFTEIPPPDGRQSFFRDLSGAGHVVLGTNGVLPILYTTTVPWLWHEGRHTLLSLALSNPTGVNRSGHVTLQGVGGAGGALWRNGVETPLGLQPTDISDRGQVVGNRRVGDGVRAVLWDDGVLTDLSPVGPNLGTPWQPNGAVTINEAGHALGTREEPSGRVRHTLWAGGYTFDLGVAGNRATPPEAPRVPPSALSDRGHVVLTEVGDDGAPRRALLWTMTYPGDPAPPSQDCVLANNWAHVRDGRAVSYLVYAWAAGTDEYLGLTTDTTALRRSDAGWRLVESC